jgi:hypothetical protein
MSDSSVPVNRRLLSWLTRTRRGIAGSESIWLIPILRASGWPQLGRGASARSGFADQSCPSVRAQTKAGIPAWFGEWPACLYWPQVEERVSDLPALRTGPLLPTRDCEVERSVVKC